MDDGHLGRMDTQRTTKAHVTGKLDGGVQACAVLDGRKHAVQCRGESSHSSVQQYGIAGLAKDFFCGTAASGQTQVQSQIEAAKRQALNALDAGNGAESNQAPGTLDDRPDRFAGLARSEHLRRAFGFGQQDTDHTRMASAQVQIRSMRPVPWGIHTNQNPYFGAVAQKTLQVVSGLLLEGFLHGILQVDNDPVRAAGDGFWDALWPRGRNKQGGADN